MLVGPSFLGRLFWPGVLLFTLIQTQFIAFLNRYRAKKHYSSLKWHNDVAVVVVFLPAAVEAFFLMLARKTSS